MMLGTENVEVYSVDEAFIDLDEQQENDWEKIGLHIRETVEQWTGIKVSVGIAPTKVLSKVANHLAKANKKATQCVVVLDTAEKIITRLTKYTGKRDLGRRFSICTKAQRDACCVYSLRP